MNVLTYDVMVMVNVLIYLRKMPFVKKEASEMYALHKSRSYSTLVTVSREKGKMKAFFIIQVKEMVRCTNAI